MRDKVQRQAIFLIVTWASFVAAEEVQFNRDIRPILSENCFACHGPDAKHREADLRFDLRESAVAPREDHAAIVPGKPGESSLLERITSADPDLRMPPAETGRKLTAEQIELLQRWIEQGAKYEQHWSLVSPRRPESPAVKDESWPRNGIDRFVLARLEREGLRPSAEAAKETWLRRVTLDLTGLPPTIKEQDDFLADASPQAHERVVDRLLASERFGERMAMHWLDLARYADTNGYNNDEERTQWPWRDWVIDAYNQNLPYDQFVVQQLAGDLLPNPTVQQRIATAFNRNHVLTTEGGIIEEEYRVEYVADRVHTTSTVFLGLSLQCARCHDHKFDPLTQKDYYRFFAFFNNIAERTVGYNQAKVSEPLVKAPTRQQQSELDRIDKAIAELERQQKELEAKSATDQGVVDQLAALAKEKTELQKSFPATMVMEEMPQPRPAFVLNRGQYDQPGEAVTAGVPVSLPPLPEGAPANRLGLAQWLVQPEHPLTARVAVNRYWQLFFGAGLVETVEDFGSQGAWPTHPELLDYLTTEFSSHWNVKALLKQIVLSATYRQTSSVTPELLERDPGNQLLARGPRFRLPAETLRDNALAISGLLTNRIGGPSVYPYQPAGLWEDVSVERRAVYQQGQGADLYRRSMYTFWKRTCPPPGMTTFDAPDRETCTIRRARTNTPLQALVLMNDPTYLEAARKLAERVLKEGGETEASRMAYVCRLSIARAPRPEEQQVLLTMLQHAHERFSAAPETAEKLLSAGASPRDEKLAVPELAAWTTLSSLILSLDETITKE